MTSLKKNTYPFYYNIGIMGMKLRKKTPPPAFFYTVSATGRSSNNSSDNSSDNSSNNSSNNSANN